MSNCMEFPDTVEEFMEQYKIVDTEHIYSNGTEYVPVFRMKQWFEHLPSAEPESLIDAYSKSVWLWLLNYQIQAAELDGRYTPYEVLSWVANDWRKEHEGSD